MQPRNGRSAVWVHRVVRTLLPVLYPISKQVFTRPNVRKDTRNGISKVRSETITNGMSLFDYRIIFHQSVPTKVPLAPKSLAFRIPRHYIVLRSSLRSARLPNARSSKSVGIVHCAQSRQPYAPHPFRPLWHNTRFHDGFSDSLRVNSYCQYIDSPSNSQTFANFHRVARRNLINDNLRNETVKNSSASRPPLLCVVCWWPAMTMSRAGFATR